jgi:exopolyphosphatase/guanosine-5'-triphosphate,3'-diphosphate pyrophosphatase
LAAVRVAAVDIGTNTVLLLVVERGDDGAVRVVVDRAEITRLGEGLDRTKRLSPAAIERTCTCLSTYAREARSLGAERIAVVGTSAMRDAPEAGPLKAFVQHAFGVDVRVITGAQEAELTFRGAFRGLPGEPQGTRTVFDIGGGSTEVLIGRVEQGRVHTEYAESFDVGSVRLRERHLQRDPPTAEDLLSLREALEHRFATIPPLPAETTPIGVAGTVTTLAAVAMGLAPYDGTRIHGMRMQTSTLKELASRLAGMDTEARKAIIGMEPKRADVIVAGAQIALSLLEHWKALAFLVSDGGIRWGLAEELLSGARSG